MNAFYRKTGGRIFAVILCFCVMFANISSVSLGAETGGTIVYDFHMLGVYDPAVNCPAQGTQEGWSIVENVANPKVSQNVYGLHIENDNSAGQISFSFNVPVAGGYELKFKSFLAGGGGITDILVDGQKIATYDFYGAGVYSEFVTLKAMNLTQGVHTLTFMATGTANGWGYRMYPTELDLVPAQVVPEPVTLTYDFHMLGVYDPAVDCPAQGTQEGWSIVENVANPKVSQNVYGLHIENDNSAGQISFSFNVPVAGGYELNFKSFLAGGGGITDILVDGQKIATYDFYGAGVYSEFVTLKAMNLTQGVHTLTFMATGTANGWGYRMYPTELDLVPAQVVSDTTSITYDFHKLGVDDGSGNCPAQGTQEGWSIVYAETDHNVSQNLYGLHVENDSSPGKITLSFNIPTAGYYEVKFKSFLAGGGGIADIIVDGRKIGVWDFYSSEGKYSSLQSIKTIQLSQGSHKLVLDSQIKNEGSWGYEMYPSEFDLYSKDSMPSVDSLNIASTKTELIAGRTAQLGVTGQLSDGNVDYFYDSTIQYTSDSEAVATVDVNGLVTAAAEGTANIGVKVVSPDYPEQSGVVTITVVKLGLSKVTLNTHKLEMLVGYIRNLSVSGIMNDDSAADLNTAGVTKVYTSENPGVASVDANGAVTAVSLGTTNVKVEVTIDGVTKSDSAAVSVISPIEENSSKTRSTYYTDTKVTAARQNIEKYTWAKNIRDQAVTKADYYLQFGDEGLWDIVTPQSLPRAFMVNQELGCPECGRKVYDAGGEFPWKTDPLNNPWKVICPYDNTVFPTNDFESYYNSGLDDNGLFDPAKADKSLLVNTLYPEKGPKWGVDDGFGYVDEDGNKFTFIAYYIHWGLWHPAIGGVIDNALTSFRDAYLYTGDNKYAHAGIILLDRIADIYPSMDLSAYRDEDGYLNSHGGMVGKGKVMGNIQETYIARDMSSAYDAFFPAMIDNDAANVIPFLSEKASTYGFINPKTSVTYIKKNIEDNILRQIYPACKNAQILGNAGWHQSALAMAAVVLDEDVTTQEWIDWVFKSGGDVLTEDGWKETGGNIANLLVSQVDRDGFGNEGSPSYDQTWLNTMIMVADILKGYDKYPGADLYTNVKFKKMFYLGLDLMMVGKYTPTIGDSGKTGNPGLYAELDQVVKGYEAWGDTQLGRFAYFLNGDKATGLHGDIFSADPGAVAENIQTVVDRYGSMNHLDSADLTGFGLSALRDGENSIKPYGTLYDFLYMPIKEANVATKPFTNSGTLQLEANEAGKYISFDFEVPASDNYELDLKVFKADSYGKYNILIDGQLLKEFDFYGPNGARDPEMIGNLELTAGPHEIRFENIGKNTASNNYKMGIIQLSLLNAADKLVRTEVEQKGDSQRDVWMYYGRNMNHGHSDTLNLGLHAFGLDLSPDLGYPENTGEWPERMEWIDNTISHNTVVVDESRQDKQWVSTPLHFDDSDMIKVTDVSAPSVYPETGMYRRTVSMIKLDDKNSYSVDFFRVKGGSDHYYSFHGPEGTVETSGLNLAAQSTGTYAGADVEYAERPADDSVAGWNYMGSGFHYLKNVERDQSPAGSFSIDWSAVDTWGVLNKTKDIHMKLTMLNDVNDVAIADGIPPQNKPGNPESLKYLVAHRSGDNLESQFVSVIEPYEGSSNIESIEKVSITSEGKPVEGADAAAVKVTLKNGRIDYIVNSIDSETVYKVDNKFRFKGFFGVYSEVDGKQISGYMCDGTLIGKTSSDADRYEGRVVDFTKGLSMNNEIVVSIDDYFPKIDELIGRYIYIENDGVRNASYKVEGASYAGDGRIKLDIGESTLVRSYVDQEDFTKGFVYDVNEGSRFAIPLAFSNLNIKSDSDNQTPISTPTPEPTATPPESPEFTDAEGNWAHKAIIALAKAGVLNGYSDGTARPNANATRAEFVQMVMKLLKQEGKTDSSFTDTNSSAWYAKALSLAVEKGWINGRVDGSFGPDDGITREEAIVIISRVIDGLVVNSKADESVLGTYSDNTEISGWARADVAKLVGLGIIKGSGNKINPGTLITRAEICTILERIMDGYLNS